MKYPDLLKKQSAAARFKWAFLLSILLFLGISLCNGPFSALTSAQTDFSSDTIFLDPGHGGLDGGATSLSGICEKDINLAIALHVKELAEADGWNVCLTRDRDCGLYSDVKNDGTDHAKIENGRSIRSLKTEDLKARAALLQKSAPFVAISIHLNSFREDRSVHGTQVFFPSHSSVSGVSDKSKQLATCIQNTIQEETAGDKKREVMGKSDVLLMKNPQTPFVLVECGFLSNAEESILLSQQAYQEKLAKGIYRGILLYSGRKPRPPISVIDSRGSFDSSVRVFHNQKHPVDNFFRNLRIITLNIL